MTKKWRYTLHLFFSYQRSDRNAILILAVLIVIVLIAIKAANHMPLKQEADFAEFKAIVESWHKETEEKEHAKVLHDFDPNTISTMELDSLSIPGNIKDNIIRYRKAGGTFKTVEDVRKIYGMNDSVFARIKGYITISEKKISVEQFKQTEELKPKHANVLNEPFDPNVAGHGVLREYGFNEFQANNLIKYRESGGYFNKTTDLLKIYGIDSVFYHQVLEHIHIVIDSSKIVPQSRGNIHIELNSVDTSGLMELYGIGATLAARIIKYRILLGGYYSKQQLLEVYNLSDETFNHIQDNIYVDTLVISKVRINYAEFGDLIKHPYLGRKEVNNILDYRRKYGPIKKMEVLRDIEGFDSELITRISPYISCR